MLLFILDMKTLGVFSLRELLNLRIKDMHIKWNHAHGSLCNYRVVVLLEKTIGPTLGSWKAEGFFIQWIKLSHAVSQLSHTLMLYIASFICSK